MILLLQNRVDLKVSPEGEAFNPMIQTIKANRGYERFRRRGINKTILEIALISCGFNLHKYHLSKAVKAKPLKAAG